MAEAPTYLLNAFLRASSGSLEPFELRIDPPEPIPGGSFRCSVRCSLLHERPHPVCSRLEEDAWAKAFELVHRMLRFEGKKLVRADGSPVALPRPLRDPACVEEERRPNVTGVAPIFRIEGWARHQGSERLRVELAIWPPYEKEHGTYCAPMRCGLRRNGEVMCSYGASPEQAVHLAYKYLQIEIEHDEITDDNGKPIEVPIPPEPPLIERPNPG